MANTTLMPSSASDRILYLDILRGIAILFIFLANAPIFSGSFFYSDEMKAAFATANLDYVVDIFKYIFIEAKFYSIFSLLFGIGFVIQLNNARHKGINFPSFFRRRMAGLLLIGLAHLFLLWIGDILALYALLGFVLIWFRDVDDKKLLIWASILLVMPIIHLIFMGATGLFYPYLFFEMYDAYAANQGMELTDWMGVGVDMFSPLDYLAVTSVSKFFILNLGGPLIRLGDLLMDGRFFKVLAMFLIGIWAGRHILDKNILDSTNFLKKVTYWGIGIGLPLNILRAVLNFGPFESELMPLWSAILHAAGVTPLACGYAAGIALIVKVRPRALAWFAPIGKTALSNYLLQTVISIFIFYGIGLGLTGKVSSSTVALIAIMVFLFQIVMSKLWLRYYAFGPIEWVWRRVTYGTKIKSLNP